jgi:uncharacterized protein YdaU (DUF1376 family)
MFYYKRNIGDYHKKAGRLSILQHGTYTLLIDACYDREKFPTREEAIDWVWASTNEEIEAVDLVLRRFFQNVGGIFVQSRIAEEIDEYHKKAETNRRIALEREEKRRNRAPIEHGSCSSVNESPPNQEPRTNNQEPIKDILSSSDDRPSKIIDEYNRIVDELKPNWQRCTAVTQKRKAAIKSALKVVDQRAKDLGDTPTEYLVRLLEAMATDLEFFSGHPNQRSQAGFNCNFDTNFRQERIAQAIDKFSGEK